MCDKKYNESHSKEKLALEHALDTRKFEIELYWKRTAYFWTLITFILGGFGVVVTKERYTAAIILSCIASVLCWAWVFINKGSKFWQENWKLQVAQREVNIIGPLFKDVLCKQKRSWNDFKWWRHLDPLTRPAAMSVSRINLLVCWFMFFTCIALLAYSWCKGCSMINGLEFVLCLGFTIAIPLFGIFIFLSSSSVKFKIIENNPTNTSQ